MKLILFAAILLVVVLDAEAAKRRRKRRDPLTVHLGDINHICDSVTCEDGLMCRVLTKCGRRRRDEVKCLRCVSPSVDRVCNNNGYRRAVLGGSERRPLPLSCHLNNVPNKFECPSGADCVANPENPGFGICCYNKVPPPHVGYAGNTDRKCSGCIPECRAGLQCEPDVECGEMIHHCVRPVLVG